MVEIPSWGKIRWVKLSRIPPNEQENFHGALRLKHLSMSLYEACKI